MSLTESLRSDDLILPFTVEALDLRGRTARLGPMIDEILTRHAYPPIVSEALGQAVTLAIMLGSALKFEGRFQLQTRTSGAINMIVVDFEAPDHVRGYANYDKAMIRDGLSLGEAIGYGQLGLTVDQGADMSRYQGIVALDGQGLEAAAQQYFRQSEQIPTRLRLAVGRVVNSETATGPAWRAGGMMVQFMPTSSERMRQIDLHPGDAPDDADFHQILEDDAWVEAQALVETIEDHELIDPTLESESLLYRLFHESGVRVFDNAPVYAKCRCSRERILDMLQSFPEQERRDMIADDGSISVTCEFCSTRYDIAPDVIGL